MYGAREEVPFREDDRADRPTSFYAATKRANELMAWSYAHQFKLPCTALRFFTVYGPWGRPDMAYFDFAQRIRRGEPITVYGDGDMRRDFTYVDDIVEGVRRIASGPCAALGEPVPHALFNIGHHEPVEVREFVRLLEAAGRTDIAVGVGIAAECKSDFRQAKWIEGYDLDRYPGKVHRDGVQAMIDLVMSAKEPMTLLCIGPLPNIAEALRREPRLAQRARFVGMQGSVRVGYGKGSPPTAEWNVRANPAAGRAALSAPWDITITPLDTCAFVQLRGEKYARVRDSAHPLVRALMENYRVWTDWNTAHGNTGADPAKASSTLFDCVAVYLALTQDLCVMKPLRLRVDDDGFTREDPGARKMNVATQWKDLPAFEDWLVQRLTGNAK